MVSPEIELFEQLDGEPMKYAVIEEHVFCSDRDNMLRSLARMNESGLIAVEINGQAVPV